MITFELLWLTTLLLLLFFHRQMMLFSRNLIGTSIQRRKNYYDGIINLDTLTCMHHVQSLLQKQPAVPSYTPTIVDIKERAIIPINNRSSHIQHPLCTACQFAKQKKRCPPTHTTGKHSEAGGASDNIVRPGMRVSTDLYASTIRGRLPDTFGRESPDRQYSAGAIFVDQASKFVYVLHQVSTTASETVRSKHQFEAFAASFSVTVKSYLADNHPFDKSEWTTDCANQQQTCLFSGVGAHHQNPSERYQQTIFNMARTMMMHFAMHWPEDAETNLWPFAVDHAVYIWNHLPNMQSAVAPIDTFTELLHFGYRDLQRLHVFGCPVYVLDPKMQDGKKLPKWQRRSRRAVYLGTSQNHGSTVALVLNLETGKFSPQYIILLSSTMISLPSIPMDSLIRTYGILSLHQTLIAMIHVTNMMLMMVLQPSIPLLTSALHHLLTLMPM